MVARERFELSSEAPEASMLDHYTTGLCSIKILKVRRCVITLAFSAYANLFLVFLCFLDAVTFLSAWGPFFAAP